MAGTPTGYQKREQTLINKYGSLEAYQEVQRQWTSRGGKASPGFKAMTPEQRSAAGRKGYEAHVKKIEDSLREKASAEERV